MKKFSKMLALGLALAMTFGMSVSAAENDSVVTEDPSFNVIESDVEVWGPSEGFDATLNSGAVTVKQADKIKEVAAAGGKSVVGVVATFSMTPNADWDGTPVTVEFRDVPALSAGEGFSLYHFKDGKYVGHHDVTWNGKYYVATISSFSDFVLVKVKNSGVDPAFDPGNFGGEWLYINGADAAAAGAAGAAPVSPKTGETLPVAGMMAVLCLAGALVCAKKVRSNG